MIAIITVKFGEMKQIWENASKTSNDEKTQNENYKNQKF